MRIFSGILGGLILAILGSILVGTTFAASPEIGGKWGAVAFLVFWVIGILISIKAKSTSKVWRRILILSGLLCLLLPVAGIIFTGSHMAFNVPSTGHHAGAEAVGAVIGGGLFSGLMGFIGLFLGGFFIIIGLLIGRDTKTIYMQKE